MKYFSLLVFSGNCWFKLDDIKTVSLGQVGDIVKVLITHVGEVGKQYMLSPFDKDAWAHHDDVMLPMVNINSLNNIYIQYKYLYSIQYNSYKKLFYYR